MAAGRGCRVRGCDGPYEAIFDPGDGVEGAPVWEIGVCSFHDMVLREGALWSEGEDGELIVDDPDAPLDVVDFRHAQTMGTDIVTLRLGHSGHITQELEIRFPVEKLKLICHLAGSGEHPDSFARGFD